MIFCLESSNLGPASEAENIGYINRTSRLAKGCKPYRFLLGGQRVERPNPVTFADITCLPLRRSFLYLVAIMDRCTRKVLAWRASNTREADFCVKTLNDAIHRFGPAETMNTDQGPQLTSFGKSWWLELSKIRAETATQYEL